MSCEPELWIPAVVCPSCGARPALRITALFRVAILRGALPPATALVTYQCRDRYCGTLFDITAAAIRDARPHLRLARPPP